MTSEPASLDSKLSQLRTLIRDLGSALVCFSGGTDSALVLAIAAQELGPRAVGMTAVSPSLSAAEQQDAVRIAGQLGAQPTHESHGHHGHHRRTSGQVRVRRPSSWRRPGGTQRGPRRSGAPRPARPPRATAARRRPT